MTQVDPPPPERVEVSLRLDFQDLSVRGDLTRRGGVVRPFVGWLSLLALLQALGDEPLGSRLP